MRWADRVEQERAKTLRIIAWAIGFLAFAVRFYWVTRVQSPFDALYSDMHGYHARAIDVLDGVTRGEPRGYAFFPWGAHVLIALELAVFGRESLLGVAAVHSLVGTVPVVCVVYFTARAVRSRILVMLAGVAAAVWQPAVIHTGYFMSEMWFSASIVLGSLMLQRFLEGKTGALGAGCAFAIAVVVRPQALLTVALIFAIMLVPRARARVRRPLRGWALVALPIVLMLSFSAARMHHLTGRWGLVSENGPLNRLFGATHVGTVEAHWRNQYGEFAAWFTPPAKNPVRPEDVVSFEGYIGDAEILDRIREEHMRRETRAEYIHRMRRNTKMLIYKVVFPEQDAARNEPWRKDLQNLFRTILVNLLPVAAFGLLVMLVERRRRLAGAVLLANGMTVVIVAALYFAEARMRMPYDPFVIVAVAAGIGAVFRIGKRVRTVVRERVP